MKVKVDRREFSKTIAAGLAAAALPLSGVAATAKIKIGHTCITWRVFPRGPGQRDKLVDALKDISSQGFHSFETFPQNLEDWDATGELTQLIDRYGIPLQSGYCGTNLTDPSELKESLAKTTLRGKMIKKYGGTFAVIAPNSVKRESYDFKAHRSHIVSALNDHAKALNDVGLEAGLHQHTGTCITTRDEVYAVMEGVDTSYMKFAPDVGQLQKGGADAAQVVRDFLPILEHMHLKDYRGGEDFGGYCPLGMGRVDIAGILEMLEAGGREPSVMVELDPARNDDSMTPLETAQTTKAYLQKLGYTFRS